MTSISVSEQAERDELAREYLETANAALELAYQEDFAHPDILEKAAQCLMRALALKPDNPDALLAVAYLSAQLGLKQRAEDALNQAQNLAPTDPRIRVLQQELQKYFSQVAITPASLLPVDKVLLKQLTQNLTLEQSKAISAELADLDFLIHPTQF